MSHTAHLNVEFCDTSGRRSNRPQFFQRLRKSPGLLSLFQQLPREHLLPTQRRVKAITANRHNDAEREDRAPGIPRRKIGCERKTAYHQVAPKVGEQSQQTESRHDDKEKRYKYSDSQQTSTTWQPDKVNGKKEPGHQEGQPFPAQQNGQQHQHKQNTHSKKHHTS